MIENLAADLPLASQLSRADRQVLLASGVSVKYPAGVFVHRAGDQKPGLSVVLQGSVRIGNLTTEGTLNAVMDCGAGFTFGELTSFVERTRTHDVVAISDTRILQIRAAAVRELCTSHPGIALALLHTISARLNLALASLEEFRGNDPQGRLAAVLLRRAGQSPGGDSVRAKQADLAYEIGVSRVTVSKLLAAMEADGLLSRGYGSLRIRDRAALQRFVNR